MWVFAEDAPPCLRCAFALVSSLGHSRSWLAQHLPSPRLAAPCLASPRLSVASLPLASATHL
eukprot:15198128-Alexandrium_andersonii.AAC.1